MKIKIAVLVFILGALAGRASNYYVATNGVDTYDGTNWPTAWQTLTNAVARVTTQNDVVLISNGTYTLTDQIVMTNGIVLRGYGWPTTNVIVDGNYPVTTNRCFYMSNALARLEALTIRNGNVTNNGGGVYMMRGMVTNCIIACNVATNYWTNGYGGGIYMAGQTSLVLNCVVWSNKACLRGGGIFMGGKYYIGSSFLGNRVIGCSIYSNKVAIASSAGKGVLVDSDSGILQDSTISYNGGEVIASDQTGGGGVYLMQQGIVSNCDIAFNSAVYGGGFNLYSYSGSSCGRVMDCRIFNNSASSQGGGITAYNWVGIVERCSIVSNYCLATGGGALLSCGVTLRNCIVADNQASNATSGSADYGGVAMGTDLTHDTYTNYMESCTIVRNRSESTNGAGLYVEGRSGRKDQVYNTVVVSNYTYTGVISDIKCTNDVMSNRFFNCCVMSNLPSEQGNIAAQPQFVDFAARDMRLQQGSPGIDVGLNRTWMTNAVDLDGQKRIMGLTRRVDMGCYESWPPSGAIIMLH